MKYKYKEIKFAKTNLKTKVNKTLNNHYFKNFFQENLEVTNSFPNFVARNKGKIPQIN